MGWPLAVFLASCLIAFLADLLVRRRNDGESGDFWSRSVLLSCSILGPALLYSALSSALPGNLWEGGFHLYLDIKRPQEMNRDVAKSMALLIPFLLWGAVLLSGLLRRSPSQWRRWLAGSAGLKNSRKWILAYTVPLALMLALAHSQLGGGPGAYPAAVWSTLAVLLISLTAIGLSSSQQSPVDEADSAEASLLEGQQEQAPWIDMLRGHGLATRLLAEWPQGSPPRPVKGGQASELESRLEEAESIAPQLIEAAAELIGSSRFDASTSKARLVLAPDDCGQMEVIVASASLLWQRFRQATLLISAGDASAMAQRLEQMMPAPLLVACLHSSRSLQEGAALYVLDVETLSERLMRGLGKSGLVSSVGLLVWFDVHRYTGVLAANVWAISRRLQRILKARGRLDLRTLALGRVAQGDAQAERFIQRLLPYEFSQESDIRIPSFFRRSVQLHQLEVSDAEALSGNGGNGVLDESLLAAWASASGNWPTWLEMPAQLNHVERNQALRISVNGSELRDCLKPARSEARVGIFQLQAGEALSLVEMICQAGRRTNKEDTQYQIMGRIDNPYVKHLVRGLHQLGSSHGASGFQTSKRLVGAEARRSIINHHLLLALAEREETGSGLKNTFLWEEEVIRSTLAGIYQKERLRRREVRFLDSASRLKVDHLYENLMPRQNSLRPLDCVGTDLVVVRDVAATDESDGERMRVDPERLPIQAYPQRVFISRGQRYRINHWEASDLASPHPWLKCEIESRLVSTVRIRNALVTGIESMRTIGASGRSPFLLTLHAANMVYDEEVMGVLSLTRKSALSQGEAQQVLFDEPLSTSFPTQGLIIDFSSRPSSLTLASLAQALRTALPVHLGAEEDALEVVPLNGVFAGESVLHGLAVVDLYPGGIGLVGAIREEDPLIRTIFKSLEEWLSACDCMDSCPNCLATDQARASSSMRKPDRQAALAALQEYLG